MNGPHLFEVLRSLGTGTLTVWYGSDAGGIELSNVVIHDAAAGFTAGPGDLLLAVGMPGVEQIEELLEQAASRGVAAVVVRHDSAARRRLTAAARKAGVALLALTPPVGWAELTSRLRTALSTFGAPLDRSAGELPEHDLVGFANALSDVIGGSVMIFSPQQDVLAASRLGPEDDQMRRQAVLEQHGPLRYRERLRSQGIYRRLWRYDEVVDVPPVPELGAGRRMAIAIRAGEEILGSIWVAERGARLPEHAGSTLLLATAPARRLLLRLRAQSQSQRYAEGVGRQLLAGELDGATAGGWLDVDPNRPCAVLSCAFVEPPASTADAAERRLADLVATQLSAYRRPALPVPWRGRTDVLLCELEDTDPEPLLRIARNLVSRASYALQQPLLGALGAIVPTLADVKTSRGEADLVLRAMRRRGHTDEPKVSALPEFRATADLLLLSDLIASRPELRDGPVQRLLEYDRDHDTRFAVSLAAYLDAFGDVAQAARAVNVHPNTLRYRLKRLGEISGLDLDDPDERLVAAIQLRTNPLDDRTASPAHLGGPG